MSAGVSFCVSRAQLVLCPWVLYEKRAASRSIWLFRDNSVPVTLEVVMPDTQNVENTDRNDVWRCIKI